MNDDKSRKLAAEYAEGDRIIANTENDTRFTNNDSIRIPACPPEPAAEGGRPSAALGVISGPDVDSWIGRLGTVPNGSRPDRIGIISVDEVMRSTTATASAPAPTQAVSITTITDPADLAELGTAVRTYCDGWHREDAVIAVCVQALNDLLEHADSVRVIRFLAGLVDSLEAVDADVHVHVDPGHHDPAVVSRVESVLAPAVEA